MYQETKLADVTITDGLLAEKRHLVVEKTLPHIFKALNNEIEGIVPSGAVENFRIAAGESAQEFYGLVSQDSDLFKWMEAAALSRQFAEDVGNAENTVAAQLDEMIGLLARAQQKDGYLNTYYITHGLKDKWNYLKESCQLYCAGHLLEAAVAHYEVTGESRLLTLAIGYADCIDRHFGKEPGKVRGYDGHSEIELALYRLYGITGAERYRKLADFFVEERGKQPYFFSQERRSKEIGNSLVYELEEADYRHSQSHQPLREQREAVGHAVKAMYLYTAAAEKVRLDNDVSLHQVLKGLWHSVTAEKMYLTGAIGAAEYGESFTAPFDLPPDLMYGETCAAIGLFFFAGRMLLIETAAQYADVMERALYNGILGGMAETGTAFFYTNALEIEPERCAGRKEYQHLEAERQSWFACPCCPPNIARLLLSLNRYLYTANEQELNVHLFAGSSAHLQGWTVEQKTMYPEDGKVRMTVRRTDSGSGLLRIRVPGWCKEWKITVNQESVTPEVKNGYLQIAQADWTTVTVIEYEMQMPPVKVYANSKVQSLIGKTAVMRGPVVYCGEEIDNGAMAALFLKENGWMRYDGMAILAEGGRISSQSHGLYDVVKPEMTATTIKLIPYYRRNNRGKGGMKVFFYEKQ